MERNADLRGIVVPVSDNYNELIIAGIELLGKLFLVLDGRDSGKVIKASDTLRSFRPFGQSELCLRDCLADRTCVVLDPQCYFLLENLIVGYLQPVDSGHVDIDA